MCTQAAFSCSYTNYIQRDLLVRIYVKHGVVQTLIAVVDAHAHVFLHSGGDTLLFYR